MKIFSFLFKFICFLFLLSAAQAFTVSVNCAGKVVSYNFDNPVTLNELWDKASKDIDSSFFKQVSFAGFPANSMLHRSSLVKGKNIWMCIHSSDWGSYTIDSTCTVRFFEKASKAHQEKNEIWLYDENSSKGMVGK